MNTTRRHTWTPILCTVCDHGTYPHTGQDIVVCCDCAHWTTLAGIAEDQGVPVDMIGAQHGVLGLYTYAR